MPNYSFVLLLRYCANLKAIRYESTSFNRIVADISHRVIAAYGVQNHRKGPLLGKGYYDHKVSGCRYLACYPKRPRKGK